MAAASRGARGATRGVGPPGAARAAAILWAFWTVAAAAPAATVGALATRCAECHGAGGNSTTPGIPSLAAQPATFLSTQLILFRERLRASEQMTPQAQGLSDETILALADHFEGQAPEAPDAPPDPALMARGQRLAEDGRCGTCHLPDYSGRQQIPRLAGQREDYLVLALEAYRDNTRGAADTAMNDLMYGVSDAEIRALAHFLSRQPARGR